MVSAVGPLSYFIYKVSIMLAECYELTSLREEMRVDVLERFFFDDSGRTFLYR